MSKRLPKTLYVKIEKDGDLSYFTADASTDGMVAVGEQVEVGVYELVGREKLSGTVVRQKLRK